MALIITNITLLYGRHLWTNLLISSALLLCSYAIVSRIGNTQEQALYKKLCGFGAYLLLLGLFLEAFQGGIKKDHATFSYYFVTGGLACYALVAFHIICDYYKQYRRIGLLIWSGQNPMIAYVCTSLFTIPVLSLTGLSPLLSHLESNPMLGLCRGLLITAIAILIATFFTKIKWFWRT